MKTARVLVCVLIVCSLFSIAGAQSTYIDKGRNATMLSASYLMADINQEYGNIIHGFGGSFSISYHGILDFGCQVAYAKVDSSATMVFAPQLGIYPVRLGTSTIQFIPGLYADMEISSSPLIWSIGGSASFDLKISRSLSLQPTFVIARHTMPKYTKFNQTSYTYGIALAYHESGSTTYVISSSLSNNEYTTDASFNLSVLFGPHINHEIMTDPWSKFNP